MRHDHPDRTPPSWRRWRRIVLALGGTLALAAGPAQASVADLSTSDVASTDLVTLCTGTAGAVTVPTDLRVPADQTCVLVGTTVQGDVDVRPGANLIVQDGAVLEGDVQVRVNAYLEVVDGTVQGQTQLRQSWGAYADASDLQDVDVRNSGFFYAVDSELTGHLSRNSETSLESTWVRGDVNAQGDNLTDLTDSVVTGGLTVAQAENGSVICTSEIDGDSTIRNNGGVIQIGGQAPFADCGTNVFGADLTLRANNTTETSMWGAIVRGDLACTGNNPAPIGDDNRVRGAATGQCSDLQPAPGLTQRSAQALGDRSAETYEAIVSRSAQARQDAAEAGPAGIGQ